MAIKSVDQIFVNICPYYICLYPHFHHGEKLSKYILHTHPHNLSSYPIPPHVALTPPYLLMSQSPSNVELHQIFRGELIN